MCAANLVRVESAVRTALVEGVGLIGGVAPGGKAASAGLAKEAKSAADSGYCRYVHCCGTVGEASVTGPCRL